MRSGVRACMMLIAIFGAGLAQAATESGQAADPFTPLERRGQEVRFKSTFGGEQCFSLILPEPPVNLPLGFDQLLTSNREARFWEYDVLNDPDRVRGDASTGFFDRCADGSHERDLPPWRGPFMRSATLSRQALLPCGSGFRYRPTLVEQVLRKAH